MRVWGRTWDESGKATWHEVSTDANGLNDAVYLTALAQVLKLDLGESPMYAANGIPQHQTIMSRTFPDFYVMLTQQQYAQYFASLLITRVPGSTSPAYNVRAMMHSGAIVESQIAI